MRFDPTVTLVNRLVDDDGQPVPQEFMYDGESVVIVDRTTVPVGAARIIVHHSMFKMDPVTSVPQYKLGVPEWDLPCEPICLSEIGDELLDRDAVGWPRQTIKGTKLGKGPPLRNVGARHDPIAVNDPRGGDGAFPGHYGDPKPPGGA